MHQKYTLSPSKAKTNIHIFFFKQKINKFVQFSKQVNTCHKSHVLLYTYELYSADKQCKCFAHYYGFGKQKTLLSVERQLYKNCK